MSRTRDELAGVVELFGALTGAELEQALFELAFKQGKEVDEDAFAAEIEGAIEEYYLVETDDEEPLLIAGPVAFPSLPENATDLPHILDVEDRQVDRAAAAETVADRLLADAQAAADAEDAERAATLVDVSYDLEAWAPVAVDDVRETLDPVLS